MDGLALALVFWPAAALMVATGYFVFSTDSMARAGLLLMGSLAIEGLIFLALAAEFLGVLMILMMAGEMVIMVFFMVMFMADPGGWVGMDMTHQKRLAGTVSGVAGVGLAALVIGTGWATVPEPGAVDIQAIGYEIMGRSMFTFLLAGVAILFAMVGGTMMARQGGRLDRPVPGENRRSPAELRGSEGSAGEEGGS
ncbi:MAG: NADH-quinone oxidoreductase subunit J family protein [Solirubrobacterales bacterium]